jgi:ATP phosphoribosyltransferase regulatory subunit
VSGILAPYRPDDLSLQARIDELRGQGETVILDLPGHEDTRAELGCTRALTQRDGKWQITPLHAAG